MTTLATNHRNKLEKVVAEAREVAETGAGAALEALAIHHHEPYGHMTPNDRKLRNRLRAHGRQLGDLYDSKRGTQAIDHLINECAYEHWHRMLFARFLAENDLLIEPEMGVTISLEECEELAKEQKIDPWMLASRYAQQMLPQIFRPDDPVLQVTFAREHLLKLERLLESLEPEVFTASDAIGWVYQFWQSKKKEEVNRSGKKIGSDELPAVTQLFTEPYMVSFLIHNTLGAWYAGKVLAANPELARNAESEEELRKDLAHPGVTWDYLRFIKNDDDSWRPAAGTFDGWPKKAAELKVLDPCCGSGHFLVAVFLYLVALRMAEEGLSARDACNAVLRDNIFGLEIDERCTQIAAFALALTAWSYPAAGGFRRLPNPHLACSGLPVSGGKAAWEKLAAGDHNMRIALQWMHDEFKNAPVLGSLLNPARSNAAMIVELPFLQKVLEQALTEKKTDEEQEIGIVAKGLAKASELLAGQYHWVITNVPYLARSKQVSTLIEFCEHRYPSSKNDLATVFLERCLEYCCEQGTVSVVLPQNWLFLTSYKKFREKLLRNHSWHLIARLGPQAFQTPMWDFNVQLITMSRGNFNAQHGVLFSGAESSNLIHGLDVFEARTTADKAVGLVIEEIKSIDQAKQLENPDNRVSFGINAEFELLSKYAVSYQGMRAGDRERFVLNHWEIQKHTKQWEPLRSSSKKTSIYDGISQIVLWEQGKGQLSQYAKEYRNQLHDMHESGNLAWGLKGIALNQMGLLKASIYDGYKFDGNVNVIIPLSQAVSNEILWSYCNSSQYHNDVRALDQKISVTNATLVKVPFDLTRWSDIAEEEYPNGLPNPYSDDPAQWIYHGYPCGSVVWDEEKKWTVNGPVRNDMTVLHVAIARLLGYHWPAELDPEMELADEQREWVKKCENLLKFADDDGIVCIPSVRGEDAAAERLRELLAAAYDADWSPAIERELVTAAQARDLDDWLRNQFFEQHCQLFHHRPFIWHIWDGRKRDGFHALVNYHKLAAAGGKGRQLLEKLTYSYLGDWITLQKDGVKLGTGGAEDRLAAALELEKRLKAILDGKPPFDIFVRWKPIEQQPIGWEPDINDGVRLNIRPFMVDDVPGGKKGAGILRWKPNIKWEKDRGKDVASAPWYSLGPQYGGHPGDRINDHHLTCEEKCKAREEQEKSKEKKA